MKAELKSLIRSRDYYDIATAQDDSVWEIDDTIKEALGLEEEDKYPCVENKTQLKEFLEKCLEQLESEVEVCNLP